MGGLKVGVFDSGVGGLSVANAVEKSLPDAEVIFKNDAEHVPYGTRSIDEIYNFSKPILQSLIDDGCQVIVVACNTLTTNCIKQLRSELSVPLIGMEPMVKPASLASKTKVICVCATPGTLSSQRYAWLKAEYAKGIKVLEPDCSDWTRMIENNDLDRQKITGIINQACEQGADQIVLGCTHYHWIEDIIKQIAAGRAAVIQPEQPVIEQLKRVAAELD